MFRPRVIPVLLLKGEGLVKSKQFSNFRYIGDPINAVRIFNELKADELVFLDIEATKKGRCISLSSVQNIGEEANMPFAVGGGITSIEQIRAILSTGAEKVVLGTSAALRPDFVKEASETFGSSTIVVCVDVKKPLFGSQKIFCRNGETPISSEPVEFAKQMERLGAGELIVQSIDRDGMMNGYDLPLIAQISDAVTVPVVALGGAGTLEHLKQGSEIGRASALAAGSLFVFHGPKKGVLVNYPKASELIRRA
jgi:imidazole glycerol-phosphate synthase subunit HisF